MVLILFALPLLLMSAIYLRIFIIISRHQKGRRINHERTSTLTRGVISASGPLVTAAAVNLPELIINTEAVVCAACAARAMNATTIDEDDPTIFILSEETMDGDSDQISEAKPLANSADIRSDSDGSNSSLDDQCEETDVDVCRIASARVLRNRPNSDLRPTVKVKLESDVLNGAANNRLNDSIMTTENSINSEREFIERSTTTTTTTTESNTAYTSAECQADDGFKGRSEVRVVNCDSSSSTGKQLTDREQDFSIAYNQLTKVTTSKDEEDLVKRVPDARRGFIFIFKRMIIGGGGSTPSASRKNQKARKRSSPSSVAAQAATTSRDSSTNELVFQDQHQRGTERVVLNNLHQIARELKEEEEGEEERTNHRDSESTLGFEAKFTAPIDGAGLQRLPSKTVSLIDSRFRIDEMDAAEEGEKDNEIRNEEHEGQRKVKDGSADLGIQEIDERARVVVVMDPQDVKGQGRKISDRQNLAGSSMSGERRCKAALKTQSSLTLRIGGGGSSSTSMFANEVKLATLPNSKIDVGDDNLSEGRGVLLKESTFHSSSGSSGGGSNRQQLSIQQLKTAKIRRQQSNPVTNVSPSVSPWECTCDNKSRQFGSKLSRSNTIGGKSQETRIKLATAARDKNFATNSLRTLVTISNSQAPSISSVGAPDSLKYHLYRPPNDTSQDSRTRLGCNYSSNAENTNHSSTYEPTRRHIHASAIPQTNTKALVTTLLILGTYLISYVPAIIFQALTCTDKCPYPLYDISFSHRVLLGAMTNLLLIAKSIIDPFIYSYRMNEIQMAITRYFSKRSRRSKTSTFAGSMQTSQRLNNTYNRSFQNSNYHSHNIATNSQHSHHHKKINSIKHKQSMMTDQPS